MVATTAFLLVDQRVGQRVGQMAVRPAAVWAGKWAAPRVELRADSRAGLKVAQLAAWRDLRSVGQKAESMGRRRVVSKAGRWEIKSADR